MLEKLVTRGRNLVPIWSKKLLWKARDSFYSPPTPVLQLLRVDFFRGQVARVRFIYFTKIKRRLRALGSNADIGKNTIAHNMTGLSDLACARSSLLVRPFSVIEKLNRESKILSIGPRTEGELLNLMGHGFNKNRIRGVDLISYSPWVDLGDMHDLPYEDDSFDAVILGWVLAYSHNRKKATSEVIRVARNGGIIAVGVEYCPVSNEELIATMGYVPGNEERITSVAEILSFFGDHVDQLYFRHDVSPDMRTRVGSIIAIFSVRK
ncbi:MAG: class I SAM-dependent methyltransferase [Deltaproteobacteria bacterium]|nr:class I SAM-dependent methyltransferase [Deltaproteobacteria bacterium]